MGRGTKSRSQKSKSQAERADKHVLYQDSVQCVEAEIDFVDETYKNLRGSLAKTLREDFCGTANTACEWIRRRSDNIAIGVDLDTDVLKWGRRNNVAKLGRASKRISLLAEDVMRVRTTPPDVVLAMNFSYWIFKQRKTLRRYFRRVRDSLAEGGLFFLDCYGGTEAFRETKDRHKYDRFTYVWDQAAYNPITGDMRCHIHFKFPDGSSLKKAFSYDWRLWTLPELSEILAEAGFARSATYWQGSDEDGEANGVFTPTLQGEADDAWIAYLVAEK